MTLKPQQMPAEDLSDITGAGPSRGSGLSGLLDGLPPPPASFTESRLVDTSSATQGIDPARAPSAPAEVSTPPSRPAATAPRAKDAEKERLNIVVYVTPGVRKRFDDHRHKQRVTAGRVVLEAISAKREQLDDIIEDSRYFISPSSELFPADPANVRYLGGGTVALPFTATPDQVSVINSIGADLGFDKRSTWIAPVLNAFLPGRKERR